MQYIIDHLVRLAFERIPGVSLLNGNKRLIGNILLVISAALYAAKDVFPGFDAPIEQGILLVGFLLRIFGDMHADAKERTA